MLDAEGGSRKELGRVTLTALGGAASTMAQGKTNTERYFGF